MSRRVRIEPPPGGWPWESPGYTFVIGWPYGYIPRAADEQMMTTAQVEKAKNAAILESNRGRY